MEVVRILKKTFSHKHMHMCYSSGAAKDLNHGGCGARGEDTFVPPGTFMR